MKRFGSIALCVTLYLSSMSLPVLAAYLNAGHGSGSGEFIMEIDAAPFIDSGRTFLPIRCVAESFGIFVEWDDNAKTTTLERGLVTASLTSGSKTMTVTKRGIETLVNMDVAPVLMDGRISLPVRFVAEAFDLGVEWQEGFMRIMAMGLFTGGRS